MNRFFVIFLALLFVAIGVAGAYAYYIFIPDQVEKIVISSVNRFGFENPVFGSLKRKNNEIIITNVALDSERFSTIKELRIRYSILKFIINRSKAQDITIKGLNLTGELSEELVPRIAGWSDNASIINNLQNFPAKEIYIESATLDLLSEEFGGIKIRGEGQFLISGDDLVSIKARATTTQKKLNFTSKVEASIDTNKALSFEAELEDFAVDLEKIGIKRGNGKINGSYPYGERDPVLSLFCDVQFASLNWYDLPLKDVKANIEFANEVRKYTLEGSTFGPENIAWNAKVSYTPGSDAENDIYQTSAEIAPQSLYGVQQYLGRNKKLGVNAYIPRALLNIENPVIQLENTYQTAEGVKGSVEIKYKDPALLFETTYHTDPSARTEIIGIVRMGKTEYVPSSKAGDDTRFILSALGNFTLKNYVQKPAFLWVAHTTVHDGVLDFGPVKISDLSGVILLGGSEAEQKSRIHKLDYTLPLRENIKHEGALFLNFSDKKRLLLDHLSLKLYGGEIKTQESMVKDGTILKKNTLDVSDINLESLTRDAQLAGIFVSGQLAGILPFEAKDDGIHVTGGLLQSQDIGIIRLSKKMTEGLFPGDAPQNVVLRKALENYHYEFFEIRLDGDLSDRIMMTLNARGKNPDMKSKKPVDVNLQIETQISLLFKALMLQ